MTLGAFFAILTAGVVSGFIVEFGKIIRYIGKDKIAITVIVDFLVAIVSGTLFIVAEFIFCDFALSGYAFLAFFVGLFLERATLGFLLAKQLENVYNWLKNIKNRFAETKVGKRFFK